MNTPNDAIANRCLDVAAAVKALAAIGVMVRKIELQARPLPLVWVWCAPVLYRKMGRIDDVGRGTEHRTKAVRKGGCEVRWLEPLAMARGRAMDKPDITQPRSPDGAALRRNPGFPGASPDCAPWGASSGLRGLRLCRGLTDGPD